jgi:hypothetical protein
MQQKPKGSIPWGVIVPVVVIVGGFIIWGAFSAAPNVKKGFDAGVAEEQTSATARPADRAAMKRGFIKTADESISGDMIVGNKFKYVGKHVDLHCTVSDIPEADFFNASCGDSTIVIEADSKSLSPGQAVRILGTVVDPMEGNNAMGGNASFPTVKAEFME